MSAAKNWGVWWDIAGAGWISELPAYGERSPRWGATPIEFPESEAKWLAAEWSTLGLGPYVAKPIPLERNACSESSMPTARDMMLYVGGSKQSFRCECGANVFRLRDDGRHECNGCGALYVGKAAS
jgi:hypothetical protein